MRNDDHEERSSVSRRGYLGAVGGLAATPLLGSLASADDTDVITVVGQGTTAHYEFSVSGDVEKSTEYGGTINSFDSIDGATVTGRTTNDPDSFAFSGEITDFESDAPVDVTINGQSADLAGASTSDDDSDSDDSDSDVESEDVDSSVDESAYGNVVNIVEAGADNTGGQSILSTLRSVGNDNTLVKFPAGEYLIDGQFRIANYSQFGMVGENATITVAPTNGYTFKLGTHRNPTGDLHVEGFTVDISGNNTGGRVFELQAADSLYAGNVTVEGKHDTPSKGPMLVGMQNSGGDGLVENVDLSDGGEEVSGGRGGTGLLVSNYHDGTVTLRNIEIGPFPDNGIYCSFGDSSGNGTVHVEGGRFVNANVAGVRLAGDGSSIDGATFVYDEIISGFGGQRPIRLDEGANLSVENIDIEMSIGQTEAIRVMPGVDSAAISGVDMDLSSSVRDAVSVTSGAGSVEVSGLSASGNSRYDVFHY
ncbi:MAG: hypothetical protein QXG03_04160 [Halalkalicoccus sp.]